MQKLLNDLATMILLIHQGIEIQFISAARAGFCFSAQI